MKHKFFSENNLYMEELLVYLPEAILRNQVTSDALSKGNTVETLNATLSDIYSAPGAYDFAEGKQDHLSHDEHYFAACNMPYRSPH